MFEGDVLVAAERLLGGWLVREQPGWAVRIGRIVEVEAYGGSEDRASHARAGRTARTAPMFGPPGRAYVYLVYGMYDCLNVVSGPDGEAGAVLIRAMEPVEGIDAMRAARADAARSLGRLTSRPGPTDARLLAGPGVLCQAMGIGRWANTLDLCDPDAPLRLESPDPADRAPRLIRSPRIGIAHAGEPWTRVRWRLVDADSPSLSAPVVG